VNGLTTLALGLRLSGESVNDPTIAHMYGDHSISGELVATTDLPHDLRANLIVGYRRLSGNLLDAQGAVTESPTWIRYIPVAATLGVHTDVGIVDLGVGVGPSTVAFAEQVGMGEEATSRGSKWGILAEGTARIHIGEMQATETGLSVEGSFGYRAMLRRHGAVCGDEKVCGFDFSALRLGLGVVAMF